MIPVMQDRLYSEEGIGNGNCLAAAIASVLELPLWMVPPFDQMFGRDDWSIRINQWLNKMLKLKRVRTEGHHPELLPEFYMASGLSARGVLHAVIFRDGVMVHDPHPSGSGILAVDHTYHFEPLSEVDVLMVETGRVRGSD